MINMASNGDLQDNKSIGFLPHALCLKLTSPNVRWLDPISSLFIKNCAFLSTKDFICWRDTYLMHGWERNQMWEKRNL